MPPIRSPDPATKRKPPPFKPPRPVQQSGGASNTIKPSRPPSFGTSTTSASNATNKAKPARSRAPVPPKQAGFRPASATMISSSEDSDAINDEDEQDTDNDAPQQTRSRDSAAGAAPPAASQDSALPPIPQKLLTRLLYEGFEDKDVKIGKEAMAVVGKYVETFVREALARAAFEREDKDKEGGRGDGFLQVEDIEKLAPQLLLDF